MSRGLGCVQRDLLEQLAGLGVGMGLLPGDGGANTRRAALRLADRGLVSVEYRRAFGGGGWSSGSRPHEKTIRV